MKVFSALIEKLLHHFSDVEKAMINTTKSVWFCNEEIDTTRGAEGEFIQSETCPSRISIGEKEDTKAIIDRMVNIRKKKRINYWVDDSVRASGIQLKLEYKKDWVNNLAEPDDA